MRMMSTIKKVNIKGPINDFKTNVSTFFTSYFYLKCKSTSFLSKSIQLISFDRAKEEEPGGFLHYGH